MYLCWVENYMRELLVLKEGGEDMCRRYSQVFGREPYPGDFAQKRLEISIHSFREIKNQFFEVWPNWRKVRNVYESIERAVIFRNGFGHANIQLLRNYLLYTPKEKTWESINEYMKCSRCFQYYKHCKCAQEEAAEPRSLIFRCLGEEFLDSLYGDIRTIDLECFGPTARLLGIPYRGVRWP